MDKLTHEQIDAMEAGRGMDALVAELVMGFKGRLPPKTYSTDISAAWQVAKQSTGFIVENRQIYERHEWYCEISFDDKGYGYGEADTAPLAISRAALKAVTDA